MSPPAAPKFPKQSFDPQEEAWFAEHGQRKRMTRTSPTTPPPPPGPTADGIGDPLADSWFR